MTKPTSTAPNAVKPGVTPLQMKNGSVTPAAAVANLDLPHPKEPTESDILLSRGVLVPVLIDGEVINYMVKPFKWKNIEDVIKVTAPLFEKFTKDIAQTRKEALDLMKDNKKLMSVITDNKNQISDIIVAFVPDATKELQDEMHIEGIADLLITAIQVNLDFFIQRSTPLMTENVKTLIKNVVPKLGA